MGGRCKGVGGNGVGVNGVGGMEWGVIEWGAREWGASERGVGGGKGKEMKESHNNSWVFFCRGVHISQNSRMSTAIREYLNPQHLGEDLSM